MHRWLIQSVLALWGRASLAAGQRCVPLGVSDTPARNAPCRSTKSIPVKWVNIEGRWYDMGVTGLVITLAFIVTTRSFAPPPFETIAVTLMLGASVTYAAAFFAIYKGIGMIGASRTAMIMNLEPVLTIGLAILLLQEGLSPHQLFGAAMVIAAIIAAQLRPPPDASQHM